GARVERLLRVDGKRERVVLQITGQASLDRVRVRHTEGDLEHEEHERGDREVADEEPTLHCLLRTLTRRARASGSRRLARPRSNRDGRASCATTRRARRASWSVRTSGDPTRSRAAPDVDGPRPRRRPGTPGGRTPWA